MSLLSDRYNPQEVEGKIFQWWLKHNYFAATDKSTKPPYAITLPPPNVTGSLHMGHALDFSVQDCLIRWKRMSGFNAMWMPGIDHAGIATQTVVEKQLMKDGKQRRQDLGREKFLEKVWAWKQQYGDRIVLQTHRMGFSLDWPRMRFTLDDKSNVAVEKVFVSLYHKNLIYRGNRLVNWSPKLESAISDLEVEHQDIKGFLYHLEYPVEGTNEKLVIATSRPETMLGDTAVAVHPDDERYKKYIGKRVQLPLTSRTIPIIPDEYVDPAFGSGVVKITPAHDFNDYEVGKRHSLPMINILNVNGTLNHEAGAAYEGLEVKEAREKVMTDMRALGLVVKEEPYIRHTPICSRTGCVVEPMLSKQWYVKIEDLATPAKRVVENGTVQFEPESWTKVYLHWMNNIQDWCISRQLWWGHRIPVWYCSACEHMTVREGRVDACEKCHSKNVKQDEDVLDTWFSSALWPFSTLGWPENTEALKTFYPNDVLVTGPDIIFFWVARMIMMGLHFMEDVPFRKVYLHGIVRDSQGRKMSKSLNNGIDPLEVADKDGADALRFALLGQIQGGKDLKFSDQRLESARNFMNKIWNASRFTLSLLDGFEVPAEGTDALVPKADMSLADFWITQKLLETIRDVNTALHDLRFSEAATLLYQFTWNDFCDWYLEFTKPILYGADSDEKRATQMVLVQTLNRILRLLHPMVPHITEEIYQKLPLRTEACITAAYPTLESEEKWLSHANAGAAAELDVIKDVIGAIRNIRGENRIKHGDKIAVTLVPSTSELKTVLGTNRAALLRMAGLETCNIAEKADKQKCAVQLITIGADTIEVVIPLEGLVDFEEEIKRIEKSIEKLQKDISLIEKKLGNENFVKNAPPEIVTADKANLEQLHVQLKAMTEHLRRLS